MAQNLGWRMESWLAVTQRRIDMTEGVKRRELRLRQEHQSYYLLSRNFDSSGLFRLEHV